MTDFIKDCPYLFGGMMFLIGDIVGFVTCAFMCGAWRGDWVAELPAIESETVDETIRRIGKC